MRNYLHLLLLLLAVNVYAQPAYDDCVGAQGDPQSADDSFDVTFDMNAFATDEGNYTNIGIPYTHTGFITLDWMGVTGSFTIRLINSASNDYSFAYDEDGDCNIDASSADQLFEGPVSGENILCFYFENGQQYTFGFAADISGPEDLQIQINGPEYNNCEGALALNTGTPIPANCQLIFNDDGFWDQTCPTNASHPDFSSVDACINEGNPNIWYEFTVDEDSDVNFIYSATGMSDPNLTLFSGACGSLTSEGCTDGTDVDGSGNSLATFNSLTAGTQYYVLVEAQGSMPNGGVSLITSAAPSNNVCAMADVLTLGSPTDGTNACASSTEFDYCTQSVGDDGHVVYYEYTVQAALGETTNLTVDIVGNTNISGTAITSAEIDLFLDCTGTMAGYGTSIGDPCSALGQVQYECVDGGTTLIIAVGSPNGDGGDFSITVEENVDLVPANDACSNADGTVVLTTDCTSVELSGTTINACPENLTGLTCDYSTQSVVWHTIDLPIDAVGIEISDIPTDVFITVFGDDACPVPGTVITEGDCISANTTIPMTGGNTYLIGVSTDAADETDYTFNVLAIVPPANDLCADAEPISVADAIAGFVSNNNCATADGNVCSFDATTSHVTWYTYTVDANNSIDLTVQVTGSGGVDVEALGGAFDIYMDCGYTALDASVDACSNGLGTLTTYECVPGNSVLLIAVGSEEGDEGQFTITINELNEAPNNNNCATPDNSVALLECMPAELSGTTINACPETITGLSCDYQNQSVVWHSITLPADAIGVEILNISPDVSVSLFDGDICSGPATLVIDCTTMDAPALGLVGGNSYLIGVSSDVGASELDYTFDVLAIVPPSNDLCDVNVVALADGVALDGTNVCATGDANVCGLDDITSHVVWYEYTVTGGVSTGLTIQVDAGVADPITGVAVQVFDACGGDEIDDIDDVDCTGGIGTLLNYECIADGTVLKIAVGSLDDEEGEFTITVNQIEPAPANDVCGMATPIDLSASPCMIVNFAGETNQFACPEDDPVGACAYDMDPVVWYAVTLPTGAIGLEITDLTPNFYATFFSGSCGALIVDGTDGCFTDAGNSATTYTDTDVILIGIGSDTADEGLFGFNILAVTPPLNDICDPNAEDISLTAGAGVAGTTACATPPTNDYCSLGTTDSHVVYYEYTVASNKSTDLTIFISASGTVAATGIAVELYTDCMGNVYPNNTEVDGNDPCDALNTNLDYECVAPNTTLIIAVGSAEGEEGEFTITITEDNTGTPDIDACSLAEPIVFAADCVFEIVNTNNVGACPETPLLDGVSSCELDEDAVIWFEAEMPMGGIGFEFLNLDGGEYVAIFSGDCDNLVLEQDCITADGQIINLNENETYLFAVALDGQAQGPINFSVKTLTPADNDDPCMAETLTSGATVTGNNFCATQDFDTDPFCNMELAESSVWYTYTLGAAETGVEISFPSVTATGPLAGLVVTFDAGCTNDPTIVNPTSFSCDVQSLTDPLTLNCLDPGTELFIMVTSEADVAGEFEILLEVIVTDPACIDNDECDMIAGNPDADFGEILTDQDFCSTPTTDCNANACAEFIGDCGVEINNVVWYSVTNDGDGEFISTTVTNADFDTPVIAIFEGSCAALTQIGTCVFGGANEANTGPVEIPTPAAGQQYWIAIGTQGAVGGEFEYCIEINSGCVNDMPCDPFELFEGVLVDNPASTVSCTEDTPNPDCVSGEISTVWYTYVVPPGSGRFRVTLTNVTVVGNVGIAIGPYDLANCNTLPDAEVTSCNPGDQFINFPCAPEGSEWFIQISSGEDLDQGDFEIQIDSAPPIVPNDLCSGIDVDHMIIITEDEYCQFVPVNVDTEDACPEILMDVDGCDFTEGPAVWYEVTIPNEPGANFLDINTEPISGFTGNIQLAVVQVDCDDPEVGDFLECESTGGNIDLEDIPVIPGETYQIIIGSDTDGDFGEVVMNVKVDVPPVNDSPFVDLPDHAGPWDLATSHSGTTCCAIGWDDDMDADLRNLECGAASNENAVWYSFAPSGPFDGFYLNVDPTGMAISGNMTVELYSSTVVGGIDNNGDLTVIETSCSDLSVEMAVPLCDPTLVYYVKVASTDGECGEFDISIIERNTDCAADECEGAEALTTSTPSSCEAGENILTIAGCLELACPEEAPRNACMADMGPTVWYQINIDSPDATNFVTQVEAPGFDAQWSIWQSLTGSCDDMTNVGEPAPAPEPAVPCGGLTDDSDFFSIPIEQDPPGTPATYWIAITALGEITDPNFTLSYAGSLGCIACSGDDSFDCSNGTFTASIDGEEVELEDFENFCPGQEVEVCVQFNYNTTGTGNDWLHGIIPTFGNGWDTDNIDFNSIVLDGDVGGTWVDYEGPCASNSSIYGLPNLCTYTNADGVLQMCNTACNPSCPCVGPLPANSQLPSGWFWNNSGGNATCVAGSCLPVENYGYSGGTNVDIDVCFDLITKSFLDEDGDGVPDEDCEDNRDLRVVFQATSDAVTGCWTDIPCILDPSFSGPPWLINCDVPPPVIGDDAEICNMGTLDIDIATEDGSATEIIVEVIDNPDVDGETDFNFPSGSGTIDNTLTNNTNTEQVVMYEVYSVDPAKPCPGIVNVIEVIIYPDIEIEFNNPLIVCDGFSIDVTATPTGGTGMGYTFEWGAPGFEMTPTINVTPVTTTTYVVTVTDDNSCSATGEVEVTWNPPVEFDLVPSMDAVCQNGIEENLLSVQVEFSSGTAPYTIDWDVDPGFNNLDYFLDDNPNSNDLLVVNEETSTPDIYTVFVDVEDANGCVQSGMVEIVVGGAPIINLLPYDIPCGGDGGLVTLNASAFFTTGPPVNLMELYTCDGIFLDDRNGSTAIFEVDPNINNCVVIVAIDQDGCQARLEVPLDVNAGPEPTLTGSSHCIGETSSVSVDNAANYSAFEWNTDPVETGSSIGADRDTNFIYVVTVTDATTGCTAVTSYEVEVDANPNISFAGSFSFCAEAGQTTVTAVGGVDYLWTSLSDGSTVSTADTATFVAEGMYNVLVINADGCNSDSTINIVVDPNLSVQLNEVIVCEGGVDTLSAGQSFATYEWEDADGNPLGNDYFVVVGEGTYSVSVSDGICSGVGSATVIANQTPSVSVTPFIEICREDVGLAPGVILNFNDQVLDGTGTWVNLDNIGGGTFLDDLSSVDFTDIAMDTFRFEFRTNTAIEPCQDVRDTMFVSVINCTCPSVDIRNPPTLCNSSGDMYNLDDLKNTLEDVTWTSIGANTVTVNGTMVDLTGLGAGTYEFNMALVNPVGGNCPPDTTASFIIVEEATVETTDNTVCNADTGNGPTTIDLNTTLSAMTTSGGMWTDVNGDPVPDVFDGNTLVPGTEIVFTYTVAGTPPCGPVSADVTITVIDCNCPQVMIVDPDPICNDSGTIDLDNQITTTEPGTWVYVAGGTTGDVVLEPGNIFNSNDGTLQLTSGLYTFNYVFDNDPGGDCISEFPINIIVSNQPEVAAVAASPCNTLSTVGLTFVDLTQQISGDIGNGVWSAEPGSEAIDITDPTNVDFDGQAIGSVWEFTFTANAVAPCVPASATVIVTVSDCDCPNINVSLPATLCNSEITPLDLSTLEDPMIGPGNWSVTDPSGMNVALSGTELSVDGVDAGDYLLTYTLDPAPAGGCQPDSTVILSVSAQNFATLGMDVPVCVNDGLNGDNFIDFNALVIAGATDGVWVDTDESGVDLTDYSNVSFEGVDPDMAFTFTYTVDSDAPCIPQSYTIVVNTDPCDCPLAVPMDPSIECSDALTVDLTQYNNATFPGTWSSTELTITDNSVDIDVAAGVYNLTYTMDNPEDGCQSSWDTTIEISNPATAGTPLEAAVYCEDDTDTMVDLSALLTDEDAGGSWMETSASPSTGGAFDSSGSFDFAGQAPGSYTFTYSIVGDAPCADVAESVEVIIEAVPNAIADGGTGVEIDCIITEVMIGGASSTGPNFTYLWTEDGGATITDPTLAQITVTEAGTYTLVVTNTETMCTNTDMVTVTVSDEVPSFTPESSDITCNGAGDGTITITNPMGGNGDYTYSFDGGAFGTETVFTGLELGEYTIDMMDSSGSGCSYSVTVMIDEPLLLTLDLGSPVQTNLGNEVSFSIEDDIIDFEIDNIEWTVGGEVICSDPTCSSIVIDANANANVNVEVTYNGGCIAQSMTQILVTQVVDVVLPNVFSPNNDGSNEVFYVNSNDVETVLSMRVYDRWGELVFVSENQPASDPTYGWNGTFKGEPLNPGVFVYVVEILFINGTTETIGGDVTIIR